MVILDRKGQPVYAEGTVCANKECNTYLLSDHGPEANVAHGQRMQSKMTVDREREREREGWGREAD